MTGEPPTTACPFMFRLRRCIGTSYPIADAILRALRGGPTDG